MTKSKSIIKRTLMEESKRVELLEQKIHILNSTIYDCNIISNKILKRHQEDGFDGFEGDRKDIEQIATLTQEAMFMAQ